MDFIFQATSFMENHQSEQALRLIEENLPFATDDEQFLIAEFYLEWGFFEESLSVLENLLDKYPGENQIKITLANIYIELNNDQEAIELLNSIDESDDYYIHSLIQLADLYQVQGLFEVAEQKLLTAKRAAPNELIIDLALGEFYFSIGEYPKAIVYYERIYKQSKELANISISARLAEALAGSGKYEESLNYFQQLDSKDPDILFKYGLTAYHADRKDISIHAWEKVLEYDEFYHSVYYELAKVYEEEGNIEKAYKISEKGLKMDEYNKELFYLSGKLAYQLEKFKESENLMQEAIALDIEYSEAVLFLVELYKEQDNFAEIVQLIEHIKEQNLTDPHYEWELAKAYEELEQYDQALKHYKKASNDLKNNSDFLKRYGYFLMENGNVKEAIDIFDSYLAYEPLDIEMVEYVERIKEEYLY